MTRFRGRTQRHEAGRMNKLETAWASHLDGMRIGGEVIDYRFESIKLRLADNCFYTPDFFVLKADGSGEIHEVKGHWEDDARVKIKVAAAQFPWFKFRAIRWDRREGWTIENL